MLRLTMLRYLHEHFLYTNNFWNTKLSKMNYSIIIGIDTGAHTGFAVWDCSQRKFLRVETMAIHRAMDEVLKYFAQFNDRLFVRIEDPRLRKFRHRKSKKLVLVGGSIARDCEIWDDFLKDHRIRYASMAPKRGMTKVDPNRFKQWTGWEGKTNDHGRDAAMLVYGY